jgi:hypothetical protein
MTEVTVTLEQQPQVDVSSRVKVRTLNDYPDIQPAYRSIARNYATPLLIGPPLCDELMALILHLYTEEEAQLAQYVTSPVGISAREIARREKLPVDHVLLVLDRVIKEKDILISIGSGAGKRYCLAARILVTPEIIYNDLVAERTQLCHQYRQHLEEIHPPGSRLARN